jgi:ElaB/YqjD/DUF883 family membrane-anchored ribosome-binding protein
MAANHVSNHKSKPGNGRNSGSSVKRAEPVVEEAASTFAAIGDMAAQASGYVSDQAEYAQDCIREHSGKSVMVSLVAGFGIGLLIGRALTTSNRQPPSRRYLATAEGLGRRMMDKIEAMIPEALSEHFGK